MPITKTQLKRNLFWNTLGTGLNAIYSTIIIIIITRFSSDGISLSGQFSYAFYISGLFSTIGYYGGRIYHISDVNSDFTDGDYISVRYLASVFMLIAAFAFCIANSYSLEKSLLIIILVGFRVFEAVSDGFYGILQKNDDLEHVGKSMIVRTVTSTMMFIIVLLVCNNMLMASASFLVFFALNTYLYDMKYCKKFGKISSRITKKTLKLLGACFTTFLLSFFSLLLLNISRYFVDLRLTDADQGYFSIILLPASIMMLMIQFIIQPFLNKIIEFYHHNYQEYKKTKYKLLLWISLMCGAVVIFTYFLGVPLFNLLYGYDFSSYRLLITISVISGTLCGLVSVLSNLMTISRNINIQVVMYAIVAIFGFIFSYYTVYNLDNAVISYFVIMLADLIVFACANFIFSRKNGM